MSIFWTALIIILILGFFLVALYFLVNFFIYHISLSRNNLTIRVINYFMKRHHDEYKIDFSWFEKKKSEVLSIKSKDGTSLKANFFEKKNSNKLAIVCHGYGSDFREMNNYSAYFYNRGFSILLPELRGHGKSEGSVIGMGWPDRLDIKKWIETMVKRNPDYQIVLFGLSMGASTVCMTVGEKLPPNVKCAISDCAYDNVYDEFHHVTKTLKLLNPEIIIKIYNNFLENTFRINLLKFDAIRQIKKAQIPMLFIHGGEDQFVPTINASKLYNAHPLENHKYIYICKGAGHSMSYVTDEKEYVKRLNEFLKKEFYNETTK